MNERLEKRETRDVEVPRVDVYENDAELLLVADLPGVPADALEVRFDDGELFIEGRRSTSRPGPVLAAECTPRDFRRVFALPEGLDVDNIAARRSNGVLEVRLPKAPQKRARKIDVRAG